MLKNTHRLYYKVWLFWFVLGLSLCPMCLFAQGSMHNRPSDQYLSMPSFEPPKREQGMILPRLPLPKDKSTESLAAGQHIIVRKFIITGNTVLPTDELLSITEDYVGKPITYSALTELRDRITLLYIQKGYINSGAVIPSQVMIDATLVIKIIEGKLTGLDYKTNGSLHESYIRDYIEISSSKVHNIHTLERQLQYLNSNRLIQHVQGRLVPGKTLGTSILQLRVKEKDNVQGHTQFNNYNTPAVGAEGGSLALRVNNLSGAGDSLHTHLTKTKGLVSYSISYEWPMHAQNTSLLLDLYNSDSDIIEPDFAELNFESSSISYGIGLRQNVYRKKHSKVDLQVKVDTRKSELLFLDGQAFEGENTVLAFRFSQIWTYQALQDALSLRSVISVGKGGIEGIGAAEDQRVGAFLTWLAQFQWAHRFESSQHQLIFRADLQLSDGPLLNMEQFAIGGHASVRGYRENTFVRDNGWLLSTEYLIPFLNNRFNISFFLDAGRSWNKNDSHTEEVLLSIGAGVDWKISKNVLMSVDLAKAQKKIPESTRYNLQDEGVYFNIGVDF